MTTSPPRELRRTFGFDEVAIVPGDVTINPDMTETGFSVDGVSLSIPVLAAAMDAVVSPRFASRMHDYGGLGVMNLEGVQARYQDADEVLDRIVSAPREEVTGVLQEIYSAPIDERLMGRE